MPKIGPRYTASIDKLQSVGASISSGHELPQSGSSGSSGPPATSANSPSTGDTPGGHSRQTPAGQKPVSVVNRGGHEPSGVTILPTTGTANTQFFPFEEVEGIYEYVNGESFLKGAMTLYYQSISCMPGYRGASFEELRLQDYQQGRKPPTVESVDKSKLAREFVGAAGHQMTRQLQNLDQRLQNIELQQQYLMQHISHSTQHQDGPMQQRLDLQFVQQPDGRPSLVISLESPAQQRSQQPMAHAAESLSIILPNYPFNWPMKQQHELTTKPHSSHESFSMFGEAGRSNQENIFPRTLGRPPTADSDLQDILAKSQRLVQHQLFLSSSQRESQAAQSLPNIPEPAPRQDTTSNLQFQQITQRQGDGTHSGSPVRRDPGILPFPSRDVGIHTSSTKKDQHVAERLQDWCRQLQDMAQQMDKMTDDLNRHMPERNLDAGKSVHHSSMNPSLGKFTSQTAPLKESSFPRLNTLLNDAVASKLLGQQQNGQKTFPAFATGTTIPLISKDRLQAIRRPESLTAPSGIDNLPHSAQKEKISPSQSDGPGVQSSCDANPPQSSRTIDINATAMLVDASMPEQQSALLVEFITKKTQNRPPRELSQEEQQDEKYRCRRAYLKRIDYFSVREHPIIPEEMVPYYRQDSLLHLANTFPTLDASAIALLFDMNRGLFAPTYKMCHDCIVEFDKVPEKYSSIGGGCLILCSQFREERDWVQGWKIAIDRHRCRAARSRAQQLRIGHREGRPDLQPTNEKERCLNSYNYGHIDYFTVGDRPTIPEDMIPLYREESLRKLSRDFPTLDTSAIAVLFDMNHGSFAQTYRRCRGHFANFSQVPECFHRGENRVVRCPQFEEERRWIEGWNYQRS